MDTASPLPDVSSHPVAATAASEPRTVTHRRNRTQLSCTNCRHSKLKCDRKEPCSQCTRRGKAAQCSIPLPVPRRRPAVSMQNRLKHLENLVKEAMAGQTPRVMNEDAAEVSSQVRSEPVSNGSDVQSISNTEISGPRSGQVLVYSTESTYVGATHWAAILENVRSFKLCLLLD